MSYTTQNRHSLPIEISRFPIHRRGVANGPEKQSSHGGAGGGLTVAPSTMYSSSRRYMRSKRKSVRAGFTNHGCQPIDAGIARSPARTASVHDSELSDSSISCVDVPRNSQSRSQLSEQRVAS